MSAWSHWLDRTSVEKGGNSRRYSKRIQKMNNKKSNKINQAHTLSSRTEFLFIYARHNSQPQTRLYNRQPTQLHQPATFFPVSGSFMAVVTLHVFSYPGEITIFVRTMDHDLCYDLKNTVYLVPIILFSGTRTQVLQSHKIRIFPADLGQIASIGSEQFGYNYA
jgi:hypothetical protein